MKKITDQKIDILLIARGLLAIVVVLWHFISMKHSDYIFLSIPGRTAVWIFFGISGYVISYGFFTKRYLLNLTDIKRFYTNRFLRIYPLFFLLSILSLLAAYFLKEEIDFHLSDIPSQFLLLQFNHMYVLNGVFWTLGIEIQYYLVAPLLVLFFLYPFKRPFTCYGALYLFFLIWLPASFFLFSQSFDGRNIISNMTHFLSGMIACKFFLYHKKVRVNPIFLSIAILAILVITNYLCHEKIKLYLTLGTVLIDMLIFLLVMLHHELNGKFIHKHNVGLRLLSFLGIISYGIYAWHPFLGKYLPFIRENAFIAVSITIILAFVSYQLVEKPTLSKKRTLRVEIMQNTFDFVSNA